MTTFDFATKSFILIGVSYVWYVLSGNGWMWAGFASGGLSVLFAEFLQSFLSGKRARRA
jgi:hypothetical protein